MAALWDCATPRGASKQAARCGAWRLLPAAAMHAHAQIAQRARRAVARGGLRYRAGHLGTSQDAGACIFSCFYGRQWSLWLRHGRAATSAQYRVLIRPDPHARVAALASGRLYGSNEPRKSG